MLGGHSGREINRGRDNAIAVLGRVLHTLNKAAPFTISDLHGGNSYIALSRDAWADVVLEPHQIGAAEQAVAQLQAAMTMEHAISGGEIRITCSPVERPVRATDAAQIITWLVLSPNGIVQMNELFTNVVAASVNLGLARMAAGDLTLRYDIRSAAPTMRQATMQKLELLAALTGAHCTASMEYPSWPLRAKSPLREMAVQVYRDTFDQEPEVSAIHVGLEIGYFSAKRPEIDAISIGPDRWNGHSPAEGMNIPSVIRCFEYLLALLARLK